MTGITHKQAQRYLRAAADGLLRRDQRTPLDAHLCQCALCRAEADELHTLEARLRQNFQAKWDAQDGPSRNVMASIRPRSRRIMMTKRMDFAFNVFGGIVTFLILGFVIISIISQFTEKPTAANETQTSIPASASSEDRLIAFVSNVGNGNRDIFTMKADGSELTNSTNNPATDESPAWSPNGTQIAFVSDRSGGRDIYVMNADGSNERKLTDSSTFNDHFSWSPDGTKIAYLASENSLFDTSQLMVTHAHESHPIALTSEPGSYNILGWSPDGQKIVYEVKNSGHLWESSIMISSVDGTSTIHGITGIDFGIPRQIQWENPDQLVLLGYNFNVTPPTWQLSRMYVTTDTSLYNRFGPTIVTSNSPIVAIFEKTYVVENQDSLSWFAYSGEPTPMSPWNFSQICKTPGDPLAEETTHTISPNREQAFVTVHCDGITRFYLENANGSQFVQLTDFSMADPLMAWGFNWSADERYVIATISNRRGQDMYRFDIQEMLTDPSTQPVQLTTDGVLKSGAVWQPNPIPTSTNQLSDSLIAFVTDRDGNSEIYIMNTDGTDQRNLTNSPADDNSPVWSPDGSRLAFISDRLGQPQIFAMKPDGSDVVQLTNTPDTAGWWPPDWSPDGQWLVATHIPSKMAWIDKGQVNLYRINADGSGAVQITTNEVGIDYDPLWSPNGNLIAFTRSTYGPSKIYTVQPDGSHLTFLTSRGGNEGPFEWSPDGSRLTYLSTGLRCIKDCPPPMQLGSVQPDGFNNTTLLVLANQTFCSIERLNGSSDGMQILISSLDCEGKGLIYVLNSDGSGLTQLPDSTPIIGFSPGIVPQPDWSPDGKFITFESDRDGGLDIYTLNLDDALKDRATQPTRLTNDPGKDYFPTWQPIP